MKDMPISVHLLPGPILYCLVKRVVVYSGAWGLLLHQFHLTSSTLSNKYRHTLTFCKSLVINIGRLAVLRIHAILMWIRIRIRGSLPLTDGSGFGSRSFYFHHWPSRRPQKTNICILLFEGTFTSFFKDKKSKRSHKTVEIKVFLTDFA